MSTATPLLPTAIAMLAALTTLATLRLAERLAPGWLVPTHRALLLPTGLITGLLILALGQTDALTAVLTALDPADAIGQRGFARQGPDGALALFLLSLATFFLVALLARGLFALTRPRDPDQPPVPRWMALLGLAPSGAPTTSQAPLRLGATLVLILALTALLFVPADATTSSTSSWAGSVVALLGFTASLSPAPPRASPALSPRITAPLIADPPARWLAEAGHTTPLPGDPAVQTPNDPDGLWPLQRRALAALEASALTLVGPDGAGKRTAAMALALAHHERTGRRIVWLGDTQLAPLRERLAALEGPSLAAILPIEVVPPTEAERAIHGDEAPAFIVVELGETTTGVALARLRYAIHRLGATSMSTSRPPVLVLGSLPTTAMLAAARAIAAREPVLVQPDAALPTAAIERALFPGSVHHLRAPPPGAARLELTRPRALPRYPVAPALDPHTPTHIKVHELVSVPGGPRGRRVLDWLARHTPTPPERRLLINLPGDREVPERRLQLARVALRHALSEAWQERSRLDVVFSRRLVEAELSALAGRASTRKTESGHTWLHLPLAEPTPHDVELVVLHEPRSGLTLEVPRESVDLLAFEGALHDGHEVALGIDGERLLVPSVATATTPLRRLRFAPTPTRETVSLHRFQGEAALEVRVTRLTLSGTHLGVRRFEGREERSHTTLHVGEAPRLIPPRPVEAVFLPLPDASEAALHALRHAIAEALPLVIENAEDLGVSYTLEHETHPEGRAGIVLWDRHPEGLGAVHDLRGPDLLALLSECRALLTCTCTSHCASCCESLTCTTPEVPLDRHAALAVLEPLFTQRSLRSVG